MSASQQGHLEYCINPSGILWTFGDVPTFFSQKICNQIQLSLSIFLKRCCYHLTLTCHYILSAVSYQPVNLLVLYTYKRQWCRRNHTSRRNHMITTMLHWKIVVHGPQMDMEGTAAFGLQLRNFTPDHGTDLWIHHRHFGFLYHSGSPTPLVSILLQRPQASSFTDCITLTSRPLHWGNAAC